MPRRASRAESVVQAVEEWIGSERLLSGARLGSRRDLAARWGVAPSTVSEALKLLEDRGRVATRPGPGGGIFVTEPGVAVRLARSMMWVSDSGVEVAEALEVRDILEAAVIFNAAAAGHARSVLDGLHQAVRDMHAAQDTAEFYRRNLTFHAEVSTLCSNDLLRSMYRGLLEIVQSHDPQLEPLPDEDAERLRARRTKVHQAIADAITNADLAAARAAVRAHAQRGHAVAVRRT